MVAAFLITLREGLEAALIVGIVLSVLRRLGRPGRRRTVWLGVAAAVAVSIAAGVLLNALGVAFEGRGEEIFEGIAMLVAAGVLTWMIFWMRRQGSGMRAELESGVTQAVTEDRGWALFSLAFIAVVREGIETALFLTAAAFSAAPGQTLLGGALGLAASAGLGWALFSAGRQLNVRAFFRFTSGLLLLFAAGLVAYGAHELQEAGLLPVIVEHVYDINTLVDEQTGAGVLLKALFGYNGNPSLLEVILYVAYLGGVGFLGLRASGDPALLRRIGEQRSRAAQTEVGGGGLRRRGT